MVPASPPRTVMSLPVFDKAKRLMKTPHPDWILKLIQEVAPYQQVLKECPVIISASKGRLTLSSIRACLIQLYPLVNSYPHWIALQREKVADPSVQRMLSQQIRMKKLYAQQWVSMAEAFGVSQRELMNAAILLKVEALTQYMWSVTRNRIFVEGMTALGFAIAGAMPNIARAFRHGFTQYEHLEGVKLSKRAYGWVNSHAQSDLSHVWETLELAKGSVRQQAEQEAVKETAIRSLEYLRMALEECEGNYDPYDSFRRVRLVAA